MPLSPWAARGVGGIVEELDRHRRIEVQPQAMLVVAEIGQGGDRHHRHIPAVGVAAAAGAGVKQEVGASPGADVAGLGQKPQDDSGVARVLHGDQLPGNAAVGADRVVADHDMTSGEREQGGDVAGQCGAQPLPVGGSVAGTGIPASRARTRAAAARSRMSMTVSALLMAGKRVGKTGAAGDLPPRGLMGAVGDGFVPAVLQPGEQAVFDFGGDMGVGLSDLVVEDVAQSAGLGDLGDVVGDHPGLVAVSEPVEGQAGFHRGQPQVRVAAAGGAVGGRA